MHSPLLARIDAADMPDDLRESWQASMDLRGDATFFEVLANHPDLFRWYRDRFYGELFHSETIDRKFKEILRLRLSTRHGCRFCNQGNQRDALAGGLGKAQVDALLAGDIAPFDAAEQAVIELADRLSLTQPSAELGPDLHQQLTEHFTDAQVLELGMTAALLAGMAKFLFAFDLVEKEPNCPL